LAKFSHHPFGRLELLPFLNLLHLYDSSNLTVSLCFSSRPVSLCRWLPPFFLPLRHRRLSIMAELPSELWNEILGYATFVFGELEERTYDPFCCPPAPELALAIKGSRFSRYNFIHVSRAFYTLSIPFLYRTILIDSFASWKRLEDCLATNKRRVCNQPDTPLNTSFIKSIHFLTGWALSRGLTCEPIDLPNLTICRAAQDNIFAYEPDTIYPRCMRFNAPRLRTLEEEFVNAIHCLQTAAHFPSLTSYFATALYSSPPLRALPYDGTSIRLEATLVGKEWPFHQSLHLDLTHLRAIKMTINTSDISSLYTIGHQIQFLDIASSHLSNPHLAASIELSKLPALVSLIIDIAMMGYRWHLLNGHVHSSLKRVGFIVPSKQQRYTVYRNHFSEFDGHRFPALEQIRILEMSVCRHFVAQNPRRVATWSDKLGSGGVRLEAADGTLLAQLLTATVCPLSSNGNVTYFDLLDLGDPPQTKGDE
jgi:hypothetical protein